MNLAWKTLRCLTGWAVAVLLVVPALPAATKGKTVRQHSPTAVHRRHSAASRSLHSTARPRTAKRVTTRSHSKASYRSYAKYRRGRAYHRKKVSRNKVRFASIHMQPARADQIQQALIKAGDLREHPTGRWDAQTRYAMKQYQQKNGFAPTGLPDAKSLMKLGLGPHPLPPDADPLAKSFPPSAPGEKSERPGSPQEPPQN